MRKLFLLIFYISFVQIALCQTDSLSSTISDAKMPLDAGDAIFNGREHIEYFPSIEGIAYYRTTDWQKGDLVFQNVLYKNVFLKYDLVADELIVQHLNHFTGVTLFTPRIRSFTLGSNRFAYLSVDNQPAGIYEELAKGKVSAYAKYRKTIQETVAQAGILRKFIDKTSYYLLKDGTLQPVKKEKDVLNLLQEKKAEINSYIKQSGIEYKSDPASALNKIVEYYNQISR